MNGNYKPGDIVLGNWTLTQPLGEGSFGRVFAAERVDFGATYKAAIKIITIPKSEAEIKAIRAESMDDASVTAYFRSFVEEIVREFALMSELKGTANVVSYEDHTVIQHTEGLGWDIIIRMELLIPLLEYSRQETFTRQKTIKLGIDICRALELCQKFNIAHRDIKPENIFVSKLGDFKLGDFGIARTVEKTAGNLSIKGTFNYMAPEVYRGEGYGTGVDIYSLGLVLYRLLNDNRTPFMPAYPAPITYNDQSTAREKRLSGAKIPPPKNAEVRLSEIVLKACAYDPKDRYPSPIQMRQELEAIMYNREEASVIYPQGDETSIEPVEYVEDEPHLNAEPLIPIPPTDAHSPEGTDVLFGPDNVHAKPNNAPGKEDVVSGGSSSTFGKMRDMENADNIMRKEPSNDKLESPPAKKPLVIITRVVLAVLVLLIVGMLIIMLSNDRNNDIPDIPHQGVNGSTSTITTDRNAPRHAPNMYVDWYPNGVYDIMIVDWYCDQNAINTYWAVHNWDVGYAGFQNKDGSHVLLMSLWDLDDGTRPTIEFVLDGKSGDFWGEGTGKQVFTNYNWEVGKWYSMRVQVWTENGKSYYGQWIREEGGEWIKTAVISYPIPDRKFYRSSMFQEDFVFNNLPRRSKLRNAYGRFYGTLDWDSWTDFYVSNTFFPTDYSTWEDGVQWNINFNSDWGVGSNYEYVWVQSGGGNFTSNGKDIPVAYQISQAAVPYLPDVDDYIPPVPPFIYYPHAPYYSYGGGEVFEYDSNGDIVKVTYYNPDGSLRGWSEFQRATDHFQFIRIDYWYEQGEFVYYTVNNIDRNGNVTVAHFYTPSGELYDTVYP
jgi:serine/threonine protein kinase